MFMHHIATDYIDFSFNQLQSLRDQYHSIKIGLLEYRPTVLQEIGSFDVGLIFVQ
jgi:hypothetical protein